MRHSHAYFWAWLWAHISGSSSVQQSLFLRRAVLTTVARTLTLSRGLNVAPQVQRNFTMKRAILQQVARTLDLRRAVIRPVARTLTLQRAILRTLTRTFTLERAVLLSAARNLNLARTIAVPVVGRLTLARPLIQSGVVTRTLTVQRLVSTTVGARALTLRRAVAQQALRTLSLKRSVIRQVVAPLSLRRAVRAMVARTFTMQRVVLVTPAHSPPTSLSLLTTLPISIPSDSPIGTKICDIRAIGGTNPLYDSTWSFTGVPGAQIRAPGTGQNITLECRVIFSDTFAGDKTATFTLTGGELGATALTLAVTFTVAAVGHVAPTSIQELATSPLTTVDTDPIGTVVADYQLAGGNPDGSGTWSRTGGSGKVGVSGTGKTKSLVTTALWVSSDDQTGKTVSIQYAGEGMATPLAKTTTFNVTAPVAPGNAWMSGFTPGVGNITSVGDAETWRGVPTDIVIIYTGAGSVSWSSYGTDINGNLTHLQDLVNAGIVPVVDLPMNDHAHMGTAGFDWIIAGNADTYIHKVATSIRSVVGTTKLCFISLGREANNSTSYPWYAGQEASPYTKFKACWNHVAEKLTDAGYLDGSNIRFSFAHVKNVARINSTLLWPGNTYLTHWCTDAYDAFGCALETNYNSWKSDLAHDLDFANLKGLKWGLQEWGLRLDSYDPVTKKGVSGGGDNLWWPKHVHKFMTDAGSTAAYETWFRINKNFDGTKDPSAPTPGGYDSVVHALCYNNGTTMIGHTPFDGPSSYAGGTASGGAFVGSPAGTGAASAAYRALFGAG